MRVRDIIQFGSRIWIKPEWGVISDAWPAISFTALKVASDLAKDFRMDRDLMISVGTTNTNEVEPEHRSKLLCVTRFTSAQPLATSKIVPEKSWLDAQSRYPDQWKWGFPVTDLWVIKPFANARDIIPEGYRKFGILRGKPVELEKNEIESVLDLVVEPQPLTHTVNTELAISRQSLSEMDGAIKREISRITALIMQRINSSDEEISHVLPTRSTSPDIDLAISLAALWRKQNGICPLCFGRIEIEPQNKLLQMSADRIVSKNGAYDETNMHITHLACNLAKNKFTADEFHEWLEVASTSYVSKIEQQNAL